MPPTESEEGALSTASKGIKDKATEPKGKSKPSGRRLSASKALTPKQQLFVVEYLVDLNATQAAIRAGYSAKTAEWQGPQLLGKTHVAKAIQAAMNKRAERTEITADYVLQTIVDTVERCRQIRPVLDRKGNQVLVDTPEGKAAPAFTFDPVAVLKGCDLLGRNLSLWKDVGSKENPAQVIHKIERVVVKPK